MLLFFHSPRFVGLNLQSWILSAFTFLAKGETAAVELPHTNTGVGPKSSDSHGFGLGCQPRCCY